MNYNHIKIFGAQDLEDLVAKGYKYFVCTQSEYYPVGHLVESDEARLLIPTRAIDEAACLMRFFGNETFIYTVKYDLEHLYHLTTGAVHGAKFYIPQQERVLS